MAVTKAQIDTILDKAKADIGALFLVKPPSAVVTSNLQAAIDKAVAGSTLTLATSLVEPNPIVINKSITLVGASIPQMMTMSVPLPMLRGGLDVASGDVKFSGVDIRKDQQRNDIVTISGDARVAFSFYRILGNSLLGQKRGIAANGGPFTALGGIIDHIFAMDQDTQAIAAWDSPGPFLIEGNTLCAAGENVLFGGSDAASELRMPSDIKVLSNTLSKRLEWRTMRAQVKNLIELKNARRVFVDNNAMEYCWSANQAGFAIVVTPRNQDGRNPWARVEDVTFSNNRIKHACGAVNLLGTDNEKPSGRLRNVKFLHNTFEDLDPVAWLGWPGAWDPSPNAILVGNGPEDVTFDDNLFAGKNLTSPLYFYGSPKCQRFIHTNNRSLKTEYGVFGANSSVGSAPDGLPFAWHDFVELAGSKFENNAEV